MEFYDVVNARGMIRDFTEEPVDMEAVKRILSAGLKAPTNDHMRHWEFVVLTDKNTIASIINDIPKEVSDTEVDAIFDAWHLRDACQQAMYGDAIPKQYDMLYRSGCLVLPFYQQSAPLLEPESLSSLNAFASIWCCIENILLAAAAEGLGTALRIPFDGETERIAQVLRHPQDYVMPCYIALGHIAPGAVRHRQHAHSVEERLHMNRW